MGSNELNEKVKSLIQSPHNMQEFANLASITENWNKINKNIKLPRNIGFTELDCPSCLYIIRFIYEKLAMASYETGLVCPHCKTELNCVGEFTGYTNEVKLEEI